MAAERKGLTRREAIRIAAVAGIGLTFGSGVVAGLVRRGRLRRVRVTRTALGTAVTVTVVSPDATLAHSLVEVAFAEIERLEAILSRHRPGTAVHRLNETGIVLDPPPALREVVEHALEYATLTGGAFDVTVAPLLSLYSARLDAGHLPSEDEVAAALSLVGWRGLRLTSEAVSLDRPGMAVTLDGIAKGYIVDRAVAALTAAGAEHVLIGASGDMASSGDTGVHQSWRIALQHPRDTWRSLGVLGLHGEAVASSGDYVQSFTPDFRLHHIFDPRTGRSPEQASAVTVVAPTAMDADALSTSVFVLGPDAGIALLDRLSSVEGMIVTKAGDIVTSAGFARYREA